MKATKYFILSAVFVSGLMGNVYAEAPALFTLTSFSALENGVSSFFKTIYYLIMFALILAAAYYATRFLAQKGMVQQKTKTMKLMESMPLGVDRSLHLVKVGSQVFLLGSSSKNIIMISEIDQEKLYNEQLDQALSMDGFDYDSYDEGIEGKDFSTYLTSMKNNLKKLKSMVRGNNNDEI